jgi:hypothetical protein
MSAERCVGGSGVGLYDKFVRRRRELGRRADGAVNAVRHLTAARIL